MAKVETKRPFPGKETGECYQACLRMVEKAGYQVFKKREVASLILCNGNVNGLPVSLSAMVPFGFPTAVMLSLSSEEADEDVLNLETSRLFDLLGAELER